MVINMRAIVKLYSKGIVVIPKAIRDAVGVGEGDTLVVEATREAIVLRPLRPKRIKLGGRVRDILRRIREEEIKLGG